MRGDLHFTGRDELSDAVGGGQRGRVGWLDDDLQIGIAGLDIVEHERIHRAFIGDEVEVGVNAFLGRVQEAVIADRVDDPEVFVAGMLIPTMSGKESAGAARVKAAGITTQKRGRLEARWARGHTHRMVGMRT